MSSPLDLDAYFARIGYAGSREPALAVLRALHALHPAAIPFENLDSLLGRRVYLDDESIERKLVGAKRGGYCFEQNALFARVLTALGFKVSSLAARVFAGNAPGRTRRGHMMLKVDLKEGPHIADVGLGSWTLSAPLALDNGQEQTTPHGTFRIVQNGPHYDQQTFTNGEWITLYRFSLDEQEAQDYEVSNWYTSTHPDSKFTTILMAARLPQGKRLGLLNRHFSIHLTDGRTERRQLNSADEIAAVLETEFGIVLPAPREDVLAALARLPE